MRSVGTRTKRTNGLNLASRNGGFYRPCRSDMSFPLPLAVVAKNGSIRGTIGEVICFVKFCKGQYSLFFSYVDGLHLSTIFSTSQAIQNIVAKQTLQVETHFSRPLSAEATSLGSRNFYIVLFRTTFVSFVVLGCCVKYKLP